MDRILNIACVVATLAVLGIITAINPHVGGLIVGAAVAVAFILTGTILLADALRRDPR